MGLWKGLVPRIIMIGTLTGLQWFIYDGAKVYLDIPRPPPPTPPKKETGKGKKDSGKKEAPKKEAPKKDAKKDEKK